MSNRKYRSSLAESIHSAASDMHNANLLDTVTMREFDASCLETEPPTPKQITAVRRMYRASQAVFADLIGVTAGYVSKLERGEVTASKPVARAVTAIRNAGPDVVTRHWHAEVGYKTSGSAKVLKSKPSSHSTSKMDKMTRKATKGAKSVAASALTQKARSKKA